MNVHLPGRFTPLSLKIISAALYLRFWLIHDFEVPPMLLPEKKPQDEKLSLTHLRSSRPEIAHYALLSEKPTTYNGPLLCRIDQLDLEAAY